MRRKKAEQMLERTELLEKIVTSVENGLTLRQACRELNVTVNNIPFSLKQKGRESLLLRYKKALENQNPEAKDEQCEKVVEILSNKDISFSQVLESVGIYRKDFFHWLHKNPDNSKRFYDAVDSKINNVEDALYQTALAGNVSAQIFWLKNRVPSRWKERTEINNTGTLIVNDKEVDSIEGWLRQDRDSRELLKKVYRDFKKATEQ